MTNKLESTVAVGNNSRAECIKQATLRLYNQGKEIQEYLFLSVAVCLEPN